MLWWRGSASSVRGGGSGVPLRGDGGLFSACHGRPACARIRWIHPRPRWNRAAALAVSPLVSGTPNRHRRPSIAPLSRRSEPPKAGARKGRPYDQMATQTRWVPRSQIRSRASPSSARAASQMPRDARRATEGASGVLEYVEDARRERNAADWGISGAARTDRCGPAGGTPPVDCPTPPLRGGSDPRKGASYGAAGPAACVRASAARSRGSAE
jgi:hypothetical protein